MKSNICWKLFLTFMKIGAFTFGGGWAMISIIEREICDKNHWIEKSEFLDLLAVAQSMPGILAVNISVSVGDKLKGLKGSLAAAVGTIIPSFLIILLIAIFLTPETIKNNEVLSKMFMGIRPAVVALIAVPTFRLAKSARIGWTTCWIPIVSALAIWALGVSPILVIIVAALGGLAYGQLSKYLSSDNK